MVVEGQLNDDLDANSWVLQYLPANITIFALRGLGYIIALA